MKHLLILGVVAVLSFAGGVAWNRHTSAHGNPQNVPIPVVIGGQPEKALSSGFHSKVSRIAADNAPSSDAHSSEGPTSDEIAAMDELAQKASLGHYALNSENPFSKRKFNEGVTNHIAALVPGIISTRASFLSDLGASADTIFRLTNHAAKIAEASLRYGGPLSDLQLAKADYIDQLKTLLTKEQYEAYVRLEKQQAIANQTNIPFDRFSPEEADRVVKLYESLNIGVIKESFLPYEGLPFVITGGPEEVVNTYKSRISQLTSAREKIDSMLAANQYPPRVAGALQTFIERQINQDRQAVQRIENPEARPPRRDPPPGQ